MKKVVLLIGLAATFLFGAAFSTPLPFKDISQHWAKSAIEWGIKAGLIEGYGDGTFRPDQNVTEAEFLTLFIQFYPNAHEELSHIPTQAGSAWWAPYYTVAGQYRLPVTGDKSAPITRGEVAQLITSAFGHHFDIESSIAFLYDSGLSSGRTAQTIDGFDAQGHLTRAEAVQFLKNLAEHAANRQMLIRSESLSYNPTVGRYCAPTLVALGDSITYGLYLEKTNQNPSPHAFPSLIKTAKDYKIVNLGVTNWSSGDLLHAIQNGTYLTAIRHAQIITLDIGSNDLLAATKTSLLKLKENPGFQLTDKERMLLMDEVKEPVAEFKQNMPAIVKQIRTLTDAPIILFTLYNPFPDFPGIEPLHLLNEQILAPFNQVIAEQQQSAQGIYIADAHTAFDGRELGLVRVLHQDFHPTLAGQQVLAAIADQAINQHLANGK